MRFPGSRSARCRSRRSEEGAARWRRLRPVPARVRRRSGERLAQRHRARQPATPETAEGGSQAAWTSKQDAERRSRHTSSNRARSCVVRARVNLGSLLHDRTADRSGGVYRAALASRRINLLQFNLGCFSRQGRKAEALEAYEIALRSIGSADCHYNLALLWTRSAGRRTRSSHGAIPQADPVESR